MVLPSQELEFLHPWPVSELWGVGPRTAERLARYGIATIGDLARIEPSYLVPACGPGSWSPALRACLGQRRPACGPGPAVKSVSHEETFATDVRDLEQLRIEVVRMADSVHSRLRANHLHGRTVTLKMRYGDFTTITRSHSLTAPGGFERGARQDRHGALTAADIRPGVRLLGVGVSSLEERSADGSEQLALWDLRPRRGAGHVASAGRCELDAAVDAIRERYGTGSVGPAALVGESGLRVKQLGAPSWGPS